MTYLVRRPKSQDDCVTLAPTVDFRPEEQHIWTWPWLRPCPNQTGTDAEDRQQYCRDIGEQHFKDFPDG